MIFLLSTSSLDTALHAAQAMLSYELQVHEAFDRTICFVGPFPSTLLMIVELFLDGIVGE